MDERKNDAILAKQAREEMTIKLLDICATMDRYRRDGLEVNFNIGINQQGKNVIANFSIVKPL